MGSNDLFSSLLHAPTCSRPVRGQLDRLREGLIAYVKKEADYREGKQAAAILENELGSEETRDRIVDAVRQADDPAGSVNDALREIDDKFQQVRATLGRCVDDKDVLKHPTVAEFEDRAGGILDGFPREDGDPGCAVAHGVVGATVRDPYTKRPIVDPVKNLRCGHVYEKKSVMGLLAPSGGGRGKDKRAAAKCPYIGCANKVPIREEDLVPDDELRKAVVERRS